MSQKNVATPCTKSSNSTHTHSVEGKRYPVNFSIIGEEWKNMFEMRENQKLRAIKLKIEGINAFASTFFTLFITYGLWLNVLSNL